MALGELTPRKEVINMPNMSSLDLKRIISEGDSNSLSRLMIDLEYDLKIMREMVCDAAEDLDGSDEKYEYYYEVRQCASWYEGHLKRIRHNLNRLNQKGK